MFFLSFNIFIPPWVNLSLSNPLVCRYNHWALASPWILGVNPRDAIMPEDGDDGFFPTSGNEMVSQKILF